MKSNKENETIASPQDHLRFGDRPDSNAQVSIDQLNEYNQCKII